MIGSDTGIAAELVEIYAVRSGMVENSVQNNADTLFFTFGNQHFEFFLAAEQRIDFHIISRIVAVIGMRIENGAEINGSDSQRFQIRQSGQHAFYVAAVKIVCAVYAVGIEDRQFLAPAFKLAVCGAPSVLYPAKSVRKDMINDFSF